MDRHSTRRFLNKLFARPEELEAWVSDCFLEVWQQRGSGFDRTALVNLLFTRVHQSDIYDALKRYYPKELAEHELSHNKPIANNPYRGLLRFDIEHAENFFGRTALVEVLLTRLLRLQSAPVRLLALVGASGSGKSSLLRAGLLARLQQAEPPERPLPTAAARTIVVRPSRQPLLELACELAKMLGEPLRQKEILNQLEGKDPLAPQRDQDPQFRALLSLCKLLPQGPMAAPQVLICVDGFEEVYHQCGDANEALRFVENLRSAARMSAEVMVILTVREDFLPSMQRQHPELFRDVVTGRQDVPALSAAELRTVIEEPARQAGRPLPAWVVERLLSYAQTHEHSLPLLQFQLTTLWERLAAGNVEESIEQAMASVDGSIASLLAKDADQSYAALASESERQRARRLFIRLVQMVDVPGIPYARRRMSWQDLKERDDDDAILTKLLQQFGDRPQQPGTMPRPHGRLLSLTPSTPDGDTSQVSVELAHEALLEHWQTLRSWIDAQRQPLVFLARIYVEAKRWEQSRHADLLLRGPDLAELRRLGRSEDCGLNLLEQRFLDASEHHERWQRLERWAYRTLLALSLLLAVAFGWAFRARSQARAERARAQAESANLAHEQGRQSLLQAQPRRALHFLAQALRAGGERPGLQFLIGRALQAIRQEEDSSQWVQADAHRQAIVAVEVDRSGERILTAGWDGVGRLWALRSGQQLREYAPGAGRLYASALSPVQPSVFLAGVDGVIREYHRDSGKLLGELRGHQGTVRGLAISDDGQRLASVADDRSLRIWDAEQRRELQRIGETAVARSVRFLPGRQDQVVTASSSGTVRHWALGEVRLLGSFYAHAGDCWIAEPSPDGLRLVTAGEDRLVKLWDLGSGQLLQVFADAQGPVYDARYTTDGRRVLVTGADHRVVVLDALSWQVLAILVGHQDQVRALAITSDGRSAVSVGFDLSLRLWDLSAVEDRWLSLRGHVGALHTIAGANGKDWVATTAQDNVIRIWNAETGSLEASLAPGGVKILSMRFAERDASLLVADERGRVRALGLPSGGEQWQLQAHQAPATALALSPDGTQLATGDTAGQIQLWDAQRRVPLAVLTGHRDRIYSLDFSPNGHWLLSGSDDQSARLFDLASQREIQVWSLKSRVTSVAFDRGANSVILGCGDGSVSIYASISGQRLRHISAHSDVINTIGLNAEGALLLTASQDGSARIWDLVSGELLHELASQHQPVRGAVFTASGRHVVTADQDSTARIFGIVPQRLQGWEVDRLAQCICPALEDCNRPLRGAQTLAAACREVQLPKRPRWPTMHAHAALTSLQAGLSHSDLRLSASELGRAQQAGQAALQLFASAADPRGQIQAHATLAALARQAGSPPDAALHLSAGRDLASALPAWELPLLMNRVYEVEHDVLAAALVADVAMAKATSPDFAFRSNRLELLLLLHLHSELLSEARAILAAASAAPDDKLVAAGLATLSARLQGDRTAFLHFSGELVHGYLRHPSESAWKFGQLRSQLARHVADRALAMQLCQLTEFLEGEVHPWREPALRALLARLQVGVSEAAPSVRGRKQKSEARSLPPRPI